MSDPSTCVYKWWIYMVIHYDWKLKYSVLHNVREWLHQLCVWHGVKYNRKADKIYVSFGE